MIKVKTILDETAAAYGISVDDILGYSRCSDITDARAVAMYLCQRLTLKKGSEIGRIFNKTEPACRYNFNKVRRHRWDRTSSINLAVDYLERRLNAMFGVTYYDHCDSY